MKNSHIEWRLYKPFDYFNVLTTDVEQLICFKNSKIVYQDKVVF